MSHVLVVDDSPMDRKIIERMLVERGDYEVRFAGDGVEAIEQMEAELPLAVVTDLHMPRMDGMELVELMRRHFPTVPVILMTANTSHAVAIKALRLGAADYVPKSKLAARLAESIEGVLLIGADAESRHRLGECLAYEELYYKLENDVQMIPPLANELRRRAVRLGLVDEMDGMRLGKALIEAIRNAMYHGNLELPLGEFEDGDRLTPGDADVIAMLREGPPYCDRRVHVSARFSPHEGRFTIRDEGPGFSIDDVPDVHADPSHLSRGGGHGLVLMRMFMDEVTFNASGNEITLVKTSPKEQVGGACREPFRGTDGAR